MVKKLFVSEKLWTSFTTVREKITEALAKIEDPENQYELDVIKNTEDIWCRDYMPIPLRHRRGKNGEQLYALYRYWPDYLDNDEENPDWQKYITNQARACESVGIHHKQCVELGLTFDGGNYVDCGEYAVVTKKVFDENPYLTEGQVIRRLEETFNQKIVVIPWKRVHVNGRDEKEDDVYGHSDGFVTYLGGNSVLLTNCAEWSTTSNFSKKDAEDVKNKLEEKGLEVKVLSFSDHEKDSNSGVINDWAYINMVILDKVVLMPVIGSKTIDPKAEEQVQQLFPNRKVITVELPNSILKQGGALHCCTWSK